jgi:hypothetical protein
MSANKFLPLAEPETDNDATGDAGYEPGEGGGGRGGDGGGLGSGGGVGGSNSGGGITTAGTPHVCPLQPAAQTQVHEVEFWPPRLRLTLPGTEQNGKDSIILVTRRVKPSFVFHEAAVVSTRVTVLAALSTFDSNHEKTCFNV